MYSAFLWHPQNLYILPPLHLPQPPPSNQSLNVTLYSMAYPKSIYRKPPFPILFPPSIIIM